jgi:hypothetical protein
VTKYVTRFVAELSVLCEVHALAPWLPWKALLSILITANSTQLLAKRDYDYYSLLLISAVFGDVAH